MSRNWISKTTIEEWGDKLIPLLDVNVLIPVHRGEDPHHADLLGYVDQLRRGPDLFGVPELVFSAVVRIVTGRGFVPPSSTKAAFDFVNAIQASPNCVLVRPAETHWRVFETLARKVGARGKLVPDVYLAALAIDQTFEFITMDVDFARFPGLTWRNPLSTVSITNPL